MEPHRFRFCKRIVYNKWIGVEKMRHGVILVAQNEIENFCENLFRKMNMTFEERATAINMVQSSTYRQLITKYSYDNTVIRGEQKKEIVSFDEVKEKDVCEEE